MCVGWFGVFFLCTMSDTAGKKECFFLALLDVVRALRIAQNLYMVYMDRKKQVLITCCYDFITFVVTFIIETWVEETLRGFPEGRAWVMCFLSWSSEDPGIRSFGWLDDLSLWWLHLLVLSDSAIMRGKRAFPEPCICIWTCFFLDTFKNYSTHDHTYASLPTVTHLRL